MTIDWNGKRILITGGTGLIGSHLVEKLVGLEANVVVAARSANSRLPEFKSLSNKIEFHEVNLTSLNDCLDVTKNIDFVFHLAASPSSVSSISKNNVENFAPNTIMTLNMLEACRIKGIDNFLFTSSAQIYPDKGNSLNAFKEEDGLPANPKTTYGWSKILGEIACKSYFKDYRIKCSIVRIFNAYGEGDFLDPERARVVASLIRKAVLYPKEKFTIFGDGNQERAFLYVKDCVEGLLLAIEKANNAEPVNLGSEEVVKIKELAEKIAKISGKKIKIEYDLTGPRGINRYCADVTRMKRILGWKATTSLDEGLNKIFNWAVQELKSN